MNKINRTTFFSILLVLAYVLSACSGAPVAQSGNGDDQSSQSGQVQEVVFTGTVDSIGVGQWAVSGQAVTVDGTTSVDANIVVGDNVKVEARVGQDGSVTAVSIETSGADDTNGNSNDDNQNDSNANDNASNSNDNQNDNSNADNSNDDNANSNSNSNDNSSDDEQEVSGIVEAITTDSITINGVVYMLADFTEFKDLIAMGDQVKIHVIVNADGTITIREIEKTSGTGIGDDNSNSNGSDDNSNSNGNDDNSNDDNGNDDNGNDDNGNDDDNDNDDNGNDDDNSNSNGNG